MTEDFYPTVAANRALAQAGLVVASSGNASERAGGNLYIKKSGVPCAVVDDESVVSVRLADGRFLLGAKPSTDTDSHRYIYNHIPEINGVVHTHSNYASAFAWAGVPIACVSTAIADEFGGDIPVSAYCEIGGDDIGKEVVRLYEITKCPAILIRQHGVFTVGKTVEDAVKAAIMVEDVAKTVWIAMQFHGPAGLKRLADDEIKRNFKRYHESYGQ